ncbi:hypothetical protein N44_01490 [Microcystis aeruginosa NIES-44]|uniref:Uncharacterized protein n=1 Tax=Microcystis aeruginosa NIES-44 TaxID=449439 RepID=A0A0A1VP17_MICAE|nr:hypothetical protein N44_01490 [Microcystis aeruginosa NIES-44]
MGSHWLSKKGIGFGDWGSGVWGVGCGENKAAFCLLPFAFCLLPPDS